MWDTEETQDELTVIDYPFMLWGLAFFLVIMTVYMTTEFFNFIGGISNLVRIFGSGFPRQGTALFLFFFLAAWTIALVVGFYFIPLTITKFNRSKQIVSQSKYSIYGKRTREFGYSFVRGQVREKTERNSESTTTTLYFETETGEKIKLNTETTWSKERNREIIEKANKYLQPNIENKT
jgi:hypothetical protein